MDSVLCAADQAMPTPGLLALNLLFGAFGLAYFVYGKKNGAIVPLICGVCLMIFPYFLSGLIPLLLVGVILILLPRFIQVQTVAFASKHSHFQIIGLARILACQ